MIYRNISLIIVACITFVYLISKLNDNVEKYGGKIPFRKMINGILMYHSLC